MLNMKNLVRRMIPKPMVPIAEKLYRIFLNSSHTAKLSNGKHGSPMTLRCIVSYNKYGGYCVPESSRHRPAAQKILANDVHEPNTIDYILSNCGAGDVVHAGTYFGDFLPALAKAVSPSAKIWAFEPNKENYRCAKITLEINQIENVVLTNAGLGAKDDDLLIKISDESGFSLGGASRIITKESNESAGAESVQIVTIDDIIGYDRDVSIVQLDVEGYEKEALTGASNTIKRCLPTIILEVLPNSTLCDSEWFAENILSLGYKKIGDVHSNSIFGRKPMP